jgi:hypothetical protein
MRLARLAPALALVALLVACAEGGSPTAAEQITPTFKGGSGSGSGGGGGGGGGGTTAPKPGQIQGAATGAVCTAGTSLGISVRKGFNDRAEWVFSMVASPTPVGAPIPPSTFPQTSLGGYWTVRIIDIETGLSAMGFGTTMGLATGSVQITNLGQTMTPGTHSFSILAQNRWIDGEARFEILSVAPVTEQCTATISVFAK